MVGDSLSAEYGLARGSGWVGLLEQRLQKERVGATVVNASVSGDTTSGGRTRLPSLLDQHKPTHVIIELGSNDALRGLPLKMTGDNLAVMVRAVRDSGAQALLVGRRMPPNYGRSYTQEFESMFATLAKAEGAALVPFMLAGIADSPIRRVCSRTTALHPNAQAQTIIFDNVRPVLRGVAALASNAAEALQSGQRIWARLGWPDHSGTRTRLCRRRTRRALNLGLPGRMWRRHSLRVARCRRWRWGCGHRHRPYLRWLRNWQR